MSKRNHARTDQVTTSPPPPAAVTRALPTTAVTATPAAPRPGVARPASSGLAGRLALFALSVLALTAAWLAWASYSGTWPFASASGPIRKKRAVERWQAPQWQPMTAEDQLIDRFVRLRQARDPAALKHLAALTAEDQPIDDAEFEPWAAGFFLRSDKLQILEIWKGEPDKDGKPSPHPRRYILVTKGSVSTPLLRIRNPGGGDSPSQLNMHNPDLVVEVREDGVIRGLRTEMHRAP